LKAAAVTDSHTVWRFDLRPEMAPSELMLDERLCRQATGVEFDGYMRKGRPSSQLVALVTSLTR
jgi:hypothetical protein